VSIANPLDFTKTKAAVAFWDAQQPVFDALLEKARTNADVYAWERALEAARLQVGQAFYEDTKDRNSPSVRAIIGPDDPWFRRLAKGG
jgi:hypothetical protein